MIEAGETVKVAGGAVSVEKCPSNSGGQDGC